MPKSRKKASASTSLASPDGHASSSRSARSRKSRKSRKTSSSARRRSGARRSASPVSPESSQGSVSGASGSWTSGDGSAATAEDDSQDEEEEESHSWHSSGSRTATEATTAATFTEGVSSSDVSSGSASASGASSTEEESSGPRPRWQTRGIVDAVSNSPHKRRGGGGAGGLAARRAALQEDEFERGSRRMDPGAKVLDGRIRSHLQEAVRGDAADRAVKIAKRVVKQVLLADVDDLPGPGSMAGGRGPFELLSYDELLSVMKKARSLFAHEDTLVELQSPAKVFGDIHGQFLDMATFFASYGSPQEYTGDVRLANYVFNGDFVDRGEQSLEVVSLLFCLKICYPMRVFLVRGNHEARDVNSLYGFQEECTTRLGSRTQGMDVWEAMNEVFDHLPLAALIEQRIMVVHGGIGEHVDTLDEIRAIARPVDVSKDSLTGSPDNDLIMDLLWSDPTDNDNVLGIHANERGEGTVSFGPDRVAEFCKANDISVIVRSHECVMNGIELFAGGALATVFSATNYCGTCANSGAILEIDRNLVMQAKVVEADEGKSSWIENQYRPPTPPRRRMGGRMSSAFSRR